MVIILIILLALSLYGVVKSADLFVDSMSSLASYLKVPTFIIALTVVAFGTSSPELAISFSSLISGNGVLTLSNVIGANIVNILLVLGVAATVHPIKIKGTTTKKEIPMLILITMTFAVLFCDLYLSDYANVNTISRSDGIILILLFLVFAYYLKEVISTHRLKDTECSVPKFSKPSTIIYGIISLAVLLINANQVVDVSSILAQAIGISDKIIGMVIIGIGTSLPELVTSIITVKKGDFDFTIENIVGTNIFNICVVLGLPVIIFGDIAAYGFGIIDMGVLVLSTIILYFFSKSERNISRSEGIVMILLFIFYYAYVIFN
jgi:cation:H+ antiporter